jgi:hypothetical protein
VPGLQARHARWHRPGCAYGDRQRDSSRGRIEIRTLPSLERRDVWSRFGDEAFLFSPLWGCSPGRDSSNLARPSLLGCLQGLGNPFSKPGPSFNRNTRVLTFDGKPYAKRFAGRKIGSASVSFDQLCQREARSVAHRPTLHELPSGPNCT